MGAVVHLGCVHKWVTEGDTFSSLPHAARGKGGMDIKVIYLDVAARFAILKSKIPSLSEVM